MPVSKDTYWPHTPYERKLIRDAAEEMAWGISLGMHFGLTLEETWEMIKDDFQLWADRQFSTSGDGFGKPELFRKNPTPR